MQSFSLPVRRRSARAATGNAWSVEDVQRLRRLAVAGAPLEIIASELRRTRSAVRNKATMHGISLKGRDDGSAREHYAAAAAMFQMRSPEPELE